MRIRLRKVSGESMKHLCKTALGLALTIGLSTLSAHADDGHGAGHSNQPLRADGHAPIGVMGDHRHKTGEIMLSYRFMRMDMQGSRIGSSSISPETITTTIPNRFFGAPGQPPTLRVVPTDMTMDMHMFGAMYAPNNNITLMGMVPYIRKSMNHLTFAGGAGTAVLGGFQTETEGIGDIKVAALIGLMEKKTDTASHKLHFNAGLSIPTGSITETGRILAPTGATPVVRLPYSMQLGSGTFDLLPAITYSSRSGRMGWGAQASAVIRLGSNDEGYSLGDQAALTVWASYQPQPSVSFSGRIEAKTVGTIDGIDPLIVGPVQTADPLNYGGETVTLFAGINFIGQRGALRGHRFALEAGVPIMQNLNGPQLETDWTLALGWQYAF